MTLDLNEALRVREEHFASGRQPDFARAPLEELNSHFTLERLYSLSERRLGDVQVLGSAAEVTLDRYLNKSLKVPYVHSVRTVLLWSSNGPEFRGRPRLAGR